MPTLHSHTHCQVAPPLAQAKTWQRVCLFQYTIDRPSEQNKNTERTTAVWRNGGCSASYDSFVVASSVVLRLNFCARIRHYAKPQNVMPHSKKTTVLQTNDRKMKEKPSLRQNQKSCNPTHKANALQHICFCPNRTSTTFIIH